MSHRIVCLSLLLAGCTSWGGAGGVDEQPTPSMPRTVAPSTEAPMFSDLEGLVTFRQWACQQPESQRERMLDSNRQRPSDEAVLSTLMLATCAPERTPGLLANALVDARRLQRVPPGFPALLDLLSAEANAYALLARQLKRTQEKLDHMVEGIRAIEAEMGQASEEEHQHD